MQQDSFKKLNGQDVFDSNPLFQGNPFYQPEGYQNVGAGPYSPQDFNPTSLAVKKSLKDIFDDVAEMITGELRYSKPEDFSNYDKN